MFDGVSSSVAAICRKVIGKNIARVELGGEDAEVYYERSVLTVYFIGGTAIQFRDDAQMCCEYRYMSTDDDLTAFSGAQFLDVQILKARNIRRTDSYKHEVQFLNIVTSKGVLSVATHNEHNGYYGGFVIDATAQEINSGPWPH